jgi:hypothetical protein
VIAGWNPGLGQAALKLFDQIMVLFPVPLGPTPTLLFLLLPVATGESPRATGSLGSLGSPILVAPTLEDLQVLVNATQEWCKSMDMSLNGAKTQYLLVNSDPRTLSTSLEVAGVSISPVQEVKYLGLQIHAKNGLQAGIKNLEQRFWIAWEDLTRAYSNLGCSMSMMLMTELVEF